MRIYVYNKSNGIVTDTDFVAGVNAVQRQVTEDFYPVWGMNADVRHVRNPPADPPTPATITDAVVYVFRGADASDALGFHERNHAGIPYGYVFVPMSQNWTTVLSHEVLELVADPQVNLLTVGPDPDDPSVDALYPYEVCDAVQSDEYEVDGLPVSNFVKPSYFTVDSAHLNNDFLGLGVAPFRARSGGYYGYYDTFAGDYHVKFGGMSGRRLFEEKNTVAGPVRRRLARSLFRDVMPNARAARATQPRPDSGPEAQPTAEAPRPKKPKKPKR